MSDVTPRATEGIPAATTAATQECVDRPVSAGWPYSPHVIIFFSSACIMVVELVAGRLIARHLGSSLYTWTSIIGVVLAGMSIGNFIGGRMADRWSPERSLGWLFLVASFSCVLSLGLNSVVGEIQQGWKVLFPLRVVFSTLFIFLLPAFVLGTISPVTAKMALDRSRTVGSTIGSVYAWGAAGSIVGTFATGFFLIAVLGAKGVVLLIAAGLGLIGLFLGPWRIAHAIWLAVVLFFLWLSQTSSAAAFQIACRYGLQEGEKRNAWLDQEQRWEPSWEKGYFTRDGDYQYVRVYDQSVYDESIGRARQIRALQLDYLIHGYVDLQDPSYLKYAYEKTYAEIAKLFVGDRKEVMALFLGGGSYTFPRWVQWRWPNAICDVAEIDPLVVEANHEALGLDRGTTIRTYAMDARMALDELPPGRRYDLILGDAFTDLSVPYHLSTVEFQRKLAARLKPHGVLMQNLIDDLRTGGLFLGAYTLTLKKVFKHVYVVSTERQGVRKSRDTFVLVAFNADNPLLLAILERYVPGHTGALEGSILSEGEIADLAGRCGNRVLTDDNAPVENLLEPVVRHRGES